MRKIKFRGKIAGTNAWIYGLPYAVYSANEIDSIQCIEEKKVEYINTKTLGQFTELTDKNGVEIYEDDILGGCNGSINGHEWKQEPITITFEHGRFNVPLWAAKGEWDSTHYLIVIGNIHDNPELLQ